MRDGGFGLKEADCRCIEQMRLVAKLTDYLRRVNERNEKRTAAWRSASAVLTNVEGWLRDGSPAGTALQDFETEMPKLLKGETIPSLKLWFWVTYANCETSCVHDPRKHAQTELVGKAVILSDGKAGTVPPDRTHGRPAAAGLASQPIRYTRGTRSQGAVLKYPA